MDQARQHGSGIGVFVGIYVCITLAIGGAILPLMFGGKKEEAVEKPPEPPPEPEKPKVVILPLEPAPKPVKPKPKKVVKKKPPPPPEEPKGLMLSAEDERKIEELYPTPQIKPLMEAVENWRNVPKNAYPELVAIRTPVDFEIEQGDKTVARGRLPAGSMMVPEKLVGDELTVRSGSLPVGVVVPVDDTDFKEQVEALYDSIVKRRHAEVKAKREAERKRRLGEMTVEATMVEWNDGSESRFVPLKESLGKGDVGVYSLYDVTKWRWGGEENIDGVEYDTAYIMTVSEAAFGITERELKALLRDGKVVHWVDPKTGAAP